MYVNTIFFLIEFKGRFSEIPTENRSQTRTENRLKNTCYSIPLVGMVVIFSRVEPHSTIRNLTGEEKFKQETCFTSYLLRLPLFTFVPESLRLPVSPKKFPVL